MQRATYSFIVAVVCLALAACNQGGGGATSPAGEAAPSSPASGSGHIETEAEAREFATNFINEQVASQAYTDDAGNPVTPPKVEVDTWREVKREGDRWMLKRGPPGNWYFNASFNADGSDPESEVVYFSE